MTFVVDSSVALTWCFAEERTPATAALLDRVADSGAFAPSLWPLEVLNALLMAQKRKRIGAIKRHELIGVLQTLPITIDAETVAQAWSVTNRLSEQCGLTVYDATYLELAQRLDLPLATLDGDLRRAGDTLGVPILGAAGNT
jgi:predicted nucleic acid-binding protein